MIRRLLIDDMRSPDDYGTVYVARTYNDGMRRLSQGGWERVYFDNDLGPNQAEGWELVKWMMNDLPQSEWPASVVIVSANSAARPNIESKLTAMGYSKSGEWDHEHEVWVRDETIDDVPKTASEPGEYPTAGAVVDGMSVLKDIPNMSSIGSSFNSGEYTVLKGIREVPLSDFDAEPRKLFYAADDLKRTDALAEQLKESKAVKPLIVVTGEPQGPYILEGAHRLGALHILGKKTFPALVVEDHSQAPSPMKVAREFLAFDQTNSRQGSGDGMQVTRTGEYLTIKDDLGGEASIVFKDDVAHIYDIHSVPAAKRYTPDEGSFKKRGFFKGVIEELRKLGVKTVSVRLQSADSRAALKRMTESGVLTNPRGVAGLSVDEHPTMFDIGPSTTRVVKAFIKRDYDMVEKELDEAYERHAPQQEIDRLETELAQHVTEENPLMSEEDQDISEDVGMGGAVEEQLADRYQGYLSATGNPYTKADYVTHMRSTLQDSHLGTGRWQHMRKDVTDAEILEAAKDAYENRKGYIHRYKTKTMRPAPKYAAVLNPEEFKRWFGDSKVVDKDGNPLVVYHGTKRPDRIGTKFNKSRATSGPMPYFTDSPEIASNYSTGKRDTSIEPPEDYNEWFGYKPKGSRSTVPIDRAWYFLSPEERDKLTRTIPHITNQDADGNSVEELRLAPESEYGLSDKSHWEYMIKAAQGNMLTAAKEMWLSSGNLYDDEEKFMDVLRLAGMDMSKVSYQNPWAEYPGVIATYLKITNPLDTAAVPNNVVTALETQARRVRKKPRQYGADPWDKNTRDAAGWIDTLKDDLKNGTTLVWTSIPDWVTKTLKTLGYDGIKDSGGKYGGDRHVVWLPFDNSQAKSAIGNKGTYDPSKKDLRYAYNKMAWVDPGETAWEEYNERYSQALDEAIDNIAQNKPPRKLMPINPARLKKIWKDYDRTGVVRDEKGVDDILDDFFDKVVRIDVNNYLSGHTSGDPLGEFRERDIPVPKDIDDRIEVAIADINGKWMISDYGIRLLQNNIHSAMTSPEYEKKILALDSVLNVVHQRSDLASWFVQGGRGALESISQNTDDTELIQPARAASMKIVQHPINSARIVVAYLRSASDSTPTEFYHGSPHSFTRFDMSKVGSGDGLNKHGYGFYFTDSEELAMYYAREALPKAQRNGMFLYTVTLRGVRDFLPWDQLIPEETYREIADELEERGHEKDANEMREELEGYHETYDLSQSYGILTHVLGGANKASEFLSYIGVPGTTAKDIHGRGNIYVAFSDDIIRMVSKTTVKE